MPLTMRDRAVLYQRTCDGYQLYQRQARAAGVCLTYQPADLRALVENHLTGAVCPYCRGPLRAGTFALGFKVPLCRGGRFTFKNLDVCCPDCMLLKGVLDAQEFRDLLRLVGQWAKPVQRHFRNQLEAGARVPQPDLPAVGSLEWFTGSMVAHAPHVPKPRHTQSTLPPVAENPDEMPHD
jgi:hypothetical protein